MMFIAERLAVIVAFFWTIAISVLSSVLPALELIVQRFLQLSDSTAIEFMHDGSETLIMVSVLFATSVTTVGAIIALVRLAYRISKTGEVTSP